MDPGEHAGEALTAAQLACKSCGIDLPRTSKFVTSAVRRSPRSAGLIAGALACLLVPGKQSMSILMTMVLGIVGSFVGGFLGYLLFHKDAAEGLLPSNQD